MKENPVKSVLVREKRGKGSSKKKKKTIIT